MFQGKTFGDAVRDARENAYINYGQTNTWGAYQCYGDPFYTFPMRSKNSWSSKPFYTDKVEAEYAIDNLKSQATSSSKRKTFDEVKDTITAITNALPAEWKNDGRIIELLADLCNKLNAREQALEYYPKLAAVNDGNYTIYSVMQFHNLSIKHLQDKFTKAMEKLSEKQKHIKNSKGTKARKTKEENAVLKEMTVLLKNTQNDTYKAINSLINMEVNTEERLSLIASGYRHLYDYLADHIEFTAGFASIKVKPLLSQQNLNKILVTSADYYRQAFELTQKKEDTISYYPYFNWLHISIALSSMKIAHKNPAIFPFSDLQIEEAQKDAKQKENRKPDFYNKTAASSAQLTKLMQATGTKAAKGTAGKIDLKTFEENIYQNFVSSLAKEGAASQTDSFINYLKFINRLISKSGIVYKSEKAEAVSRIIKKIEPRKK
jgi:hypothetical protein